MWSQPIWYVQEVMIDFAVNNCWCDKSRVYAHKIVYVPNKALFHSLLKPVMAELCSVMFQGELRVTVKTEKGS